MLKRLGCILIIVLLTVGLSSSANGSEPVVLNFWGAIPPENGPGLLVENWNKENPDIQVTYTRFVNDDAGNLKLENAILAGEVDVFINYLAANLEKRWEAGLMYPLDEYVVKDGIDLLNEFGESNYYRDGKLYFIPTSGGGNAYMMYNKSMTDAAGLILPTDSWTWEEFEETAKALTKGEGNNKVFGASMGGTIANDDWAWPAQMTYGGDYYYKSSEESNFDDPLFLLGMMTRYRMEVVDKTMVNRMDIKVTNYDVPTEFANGKIGMVLCNYHIRDLKNTEKYPHDFMISFAPLPTPEGQEKVYSGGLREWIAIYSNSKHKDQAWKFLKYYATVGFTPMSISGRIPAYKDADIEETVNLILGENADKLFDVEAYKKVVLENPRHADNVITITKGKNEINILMGEIFEMVLMEEVTPEEGMKLLKKNADTILQRLK